MAIHTITMPDRKHGREPRTIIWDDEVGAIRGDHSLIPELRRVFGADKPVTVGDPGGTWDLVDPAHDATEFLTLVGDLYWPVLHEPLRSSLPAVFDGITVPRPDPGEILYNPDGSVMA